MKFTLSRPPPGPFDVTHPSLITSDKPFRSKPCITFYIEDGRLLDFIKGEELRGHAPIVIDKHDRDLSKRRKENDNPNYKVMPGWIFFFFKSGASAFR